MCTSAVCHAKDGGRLSQRPSQHCCKLSLERLSDKREIAFLAPATPISDELPDAEP